MIATTAPDLVILDLGLPDMDGKDVIARCAPGRRCRSSCLSARDREAEKIAALDLGADDYVNKPFGIGELMARIRTALTACRRTAETANVLRGSEVSSSILPRTASPGAGTRLHLTPKEFDLLALLVQNAGRVLTHRQMLSAIWGPAHVEDMQYLRVLIGQLRQKTKHNPAEPSLILTEPGIGYRCASEQD